MGLSKWYSAILTTDKNAFMVAKKNGKECGFDIELLSVKKIQENGIDFDILLVAVRKDAIEQKIIN